MVGLSLQKWFMLYNAISLSIIIPPEESRLSKGNATALYQADIFPSVLSMVSSSYALHSICGMKVKSLLA